MVKKKSSSVIVLPRTFDYKHDEITVGGQVLKQHKENGVIIIDELNFKEVSLSGSAYARLTDKEAQEVVRLLRRVTKTPVWVYA